MNFMPRQSDTIATASYRYVPTTQPRIIAHYSVTPKDHVDTFYRNFNKWKSETYFVSSSWELRDHPSFKTIVRMGDIAIPFILDELKKQPNLILLALTEIVPENPVLERDRGNIAAMTNSWLSWGARNGY